MKRAVVIGSGMGGLTAALLLQRQGLDVTVLERHTRPGGMLHRFFREGVGYDTGFHYCGSIAAGDALGQVLRHLGVFGDLRFRALDPDGFDRLLFPDGFRFSVPVGWAAYEARLIDTFPEEADGIRAVLAVFRSATLAYGLYNLQPGGDLQRLIAVEETTVDSVLRAHLRDPRCRAVLGAQGLLYGVPPERAPLGVHAVVLDHFLRGAWSLDGGGDALARTLARRVRRQGGAVRLRTEATRIEVEGGRAVAVHTRDGERLPADLVISNLHPRLTLALLPTDALRPASRAKVLAQQVGHGHLGIYLRVRGQASIFGNANVYRFGAWEPSESYASARPDHVPMYYATAPHERAPHPRDPDGTVLMVLPLAWEDVAAWADTEEGSRPPAYEALKAALTDAAVRALIADFPALGERITRIEASTPLSTVTYTSSPRGATYGHLHAVGQMGRDRPLPFLRVKNVLMVGQGVGLPGVLGTALSAYYAVGRVFGMEPLVQELSEA